MRASIADDSGAVAMEISNGIQALLREYSGRGPSEARTLIDRDTVVVILVDTLTKGERVVAQDDPHHVLNGRLRIQQAMADDAKALVEEKTGRRVIAFMSANHISPDMAAEVFVLDSTVHSA
jgi:uncharacterized protein YbcI